jgi:hypothetical protein
VAALTSMPLMKIAATNVENERKASAVISCLPWRLLRRTICVADRHLSKLDRYRPADAMAAHIVSTSGAVVDEAGGADDEGGAPGWRM